MASDVTTDTAAVVTVSAVYGYDRNNNTVATTVGPGGVAGAGVNRYYYDRANRLINWYTPAGTGNDYAYDRNGNRTRNGPVTSSYDLRNRIVQHDTTSYSWAPRGVLTATTTGGVATAFTHDAFAEMTGSGTVTYTYDGLARPATRTNGTATTAFGYTGAGIDPTSDGTYTYTRTPAGTPVATAQGATRLLTNLNRHGDLTATVTTGGATPATVMQGRVIASASPGVSNDELLLRVIEAVESGQMVVVRDAHTLAWSDQAIGQYLERSDPAPTGSHNDYSSSRDYEMPAA
ncbi:MAG: hypothetical protein AAB131_14315 [Actinomycetota bacterium]